MTLKSLIAAAFAAAFAFAAPAQAGWTGCYVGAQAGVASTNADTSFDVVGAGSILEMSGLGTAGGVFGVHAGCDVQIQKFVVGAFADYAWHNQAIEINSPLLLANIGKVETESQWTVGARAGIAFTDATLFYGLVGYTQVNTSDLSVLNGAATFGLEAFKGWTFGGGIASEIMPNVRLTLEYRYAKLDKQTVDLIPGFLATTIQPDQHTAMARLSYAFSFAGK